MTKRGTSNGNSAGSAEDRRRRRKWLLETFAADVVLVQLEFDDAPRPVARSVADLYAEELIECCRCYRCGKLLTLETLTVDRIVPGCKGGRYVRNNIRPACSKCNESTGGKLSGKGKKVPVVRPRVPELAAGDTPAGGRSAGAVAVSDVQASGQADIRVNGKVA